MRKGFHSALFSILTPEQANYIKPVNPAPLRQFLDTNYDDAIQCVNALLKMPKSEKSNETY